MSIGKTLTFLALLFGFLALLSCFYAPLLFWGLLCSVAGTVCAIFVIFRRTRYMLETKWNHPVVLALVLSSAPVLYLICIIFIFSKTA
ncbi:MAG: hypothetical protein JST67_04165 [Bacteroidetes bacterium]|nr:hypothetical protein [Bacteroidota bacterium]